MNINTIIAPPKYRRLRRTFRSREFKLLDIGTFADSPTMAKRWLPQCRYHALDIVDEHLTAEDRAKIDTLYLADLEKDPLDALPDGFFDAIVIAHVLEHLHNGLPALERLSRKLAPGGFLYAEFPSVRALNLPEAKHTLNFSDDATHVRVYSIQEVANTLMLGGLRIVRAGRRREWLRVALGLATLPVQLLTYLREGRLHGQGLWDLLGFADFVYARKPAAVSTA